MEEKEKEEAVWVGGEDGRVELHQFYPFTMYCEFASNIAAHCNREQGAREVPEFWQKVHLNSAKGIQDSTPKRA